MEIPEDKLPRHVAIIMDGNGRWAHERNLSRTEGHLAGAESAKEVGQCCMDLSIPCLTLYAFSTENWKRPASEVRFLMKHLRDYLREQRSEFVKHDVRFVAIGRTDGLPARVRKEVAETERKTQSCGKMTLAVALNYGGRAEIVDACRAAARRVERGELSAQQIDETILDQGLYTAGLPPLDLLIRTGAERRVSNFLLWQLYYAELYFTDVLWPDFRREQFLEALQDFVRRKRRFGATEAPL